MSNFNQEAYDRATGRRDLARTDLEELAQQVEDGELDEETAAGLRSGYETELAAAKIGAERMAESFAFATGLEVVVLRPFSVSGQNA